MFNNECNKFMPCSWLNNIPILRKEDENNNEGRKEPGL